MTMGVAWMVSDEWMGGILYLAGWLVDVVDVVDVNDIPILRCV